MKTKFFLLGALLSLIYMTWGSQALASVVFSTTIDKTSYLPMEPITVSVMAFNSDDVGVTLTFASSLQAYYIMDGVYDWSYGKIFLDVITYESIPAHSSYTWNFQHNFNAYTPAAGLHSVTGYLNFSGPDYQTQPYQFNVVPEPSAFALLGAGAISLLAYFWRRRKSTSLKQVGGDIPGKSTYGLQIR